MTEERNNTGSILIVDDESSLRETFEFFLTREGYQPVYTASNFEEALRIIGANAIDLVISDIVLERYSGIDLLKNTREQGINCPFIMITGYPEVESAAEAVRLGAFDYLTKPIDKQQLLRSVGMALRHQHLEKQRRIAEQQRERYRVLLDKVFKSVSDAIIVVDAELTIVKLNDAAERLFADFLPGIGEGSQLTAKVDRDEFSTLRADLLRVLKTGEDIGEHCFECKTITLKPRILSICTSPIRQNRTTYLGAVVVIRDMSGRSHSTTNRRAGFHRFVGASDAMQNVYTTIEHVGASDTTVLITGESGTGKELAAEALHLESKRHAGPLIKLDCTAITENLLESELFGHKRGSFTGADRDRPGLILQARGGTLFLDEIGEISAMTQLRLLRFLQEKTFYPVGSDTPIEVDARVITATNVNLRQKVEEGLFREDLYYRLRVIDVVLPPLRERNGDVRLLAHHFVSLFSKKGGKPVSGFSDNAMYLLERYPWPGNVRELEHCVERAVVLSKTPTITTQDLPEELRTQTPAVSSPAPRIDDLPPTQADSEAGGMTPRAKRDDIAHTIVATLARCGGNKAKAARLLGIDRSTLYRKIREHNIDLSAIALE
jgi:two-component system response regulator HydG